MRTTVSPIISTQPVDRARLTRDASHFYLRPAAVATPRDLHDVAALMTTAQRPVTFRSGGTSLSGQGVTDQLLVDVRKLQQDIVVHDNGKYVTCQPGAVLRTVNAYLAPYRTKIGPDPASETACTMGGVVANNSSGMTSGHTKTAYYTLKDVVFVLPSGTIIDTKQASARQDFMSREPALARELEAIRDEIRSSPKLLEIIKHQFSMKNTMGYSVNAFVDYDHPLDIFAHLLVGSEGTLAYIASVTMETVPVLPHIASSLCVFETPRHATDAIQSLSDAGAVAVEMLDSVSLKVSMRDPEAAALFGDFTIKDHCALLVELQAPTMEQLHAQEQTMRQTIGTLPLSLPAELTTDAKARAQMWSTRKVLYAAVAGARPLGTMALIEDIVVPHAELTQTVVELQQLLSDHDYVDPVIFGHAKDANLHFLIAPQLQDPKQLATFEHFTGALVDLVLSHDGSLKAEHGTGRIMAPFVERQFGPELYGMMRRIKAAADPRSILNPGTIISDDPNLHIKDLKAFPQVDDHIDTCVECGYCEPVCPSRLVTTTPRQRIALLREIVSLKAEGNLQAAQAIEEALPYHSHETCAADSLCVTQCPMSIDTGKLVKRARAAHNSGVMQSLGNTVANHWGGTQSALRLGLRAANVVPEGALTSLSSGVRSVLDRVSARSLDWVPQVPQVMAPARGARSRVHSSANVSIGVSGDPIGVWMPSCINGVFGASRQDGVMRDVVYLLAKTGLTVATPQAIDSLCCTTMWSSKGLVKGATTMATKTFDALWDITQEGRLPVLSDASSCSHGLDELATYLDDERQRRHARMTVTDIVPFTVEHILPRLTIHEDAKWQRIALHPTCSAKHMGDVEAMQAIGNLIAHEAVVAPDWGCCGSAGDRFMLHPELSEGATRHELKSLDRLGPFERYGSVNRTCEMGLQERTSHRWQHIVELLAEVVRLSVAIS